MDGQVAGVIVGGGLTKWISRCILYNSEIDNGGRQMVRVGDKAFYAMSASRRIALLVRRGYKEAAFRYKGDAAKFAGLWEKKGYKVGIMRWSSGPVADGSNRDRVPRAYYVIARK